MGRERIGACQGGSVGREEQCRHGRNNQDSAETQTAGRETEEDKS